MDIAMLTLLAYNIAKPFLDKTGEGIARKVGEDIWNLIKKTFTQKGVKDPEKLLTTTPEAFKARLEKELLENPEFEAELAQSIGEAQKALQSNFQQNILTENVEKQVNIQNNTGNIQM